MNTLDHYAAVIGIDWADRKHDLCLKPAGGDALEYSVLPHSAEAIDDWANALRQRFPDQQIAICIESRKVPLIHALLKYPFLVLYPVNPQTLARYRRALRPSRAKDDPSDAQLLLDLVMRHPEQFHPWMPERPEAFKGAIPLTTDPGVIQPHQLLARSPVHRLALILGYLAEFDRQIDKQFKALDDAPLFAALPGAGQQLAPRLLVAFGEDRQRFTSAESLCRHAGIAPVTERSGNKAWVHWRYSCPRFLRQTFVEWANESIRFSFWARAFYQLQRERGKTHQMAVRSLAFKWVRILSRCWQDRKPYDEAKYLMALKDKGSPLVAELAK